MTSAASSTIVPFGLWPSPISASLVAAGASLVFSFRIGYRETIDLFLSYGGQTGFLRMRHETVCIRARVDKDAMSQDTEPPDTMLLDFR